MKKWLKENIFVKDMFVYIVVASIIFYIPSWGALIFAIIYNSPYLYGFSAAYILFWAGPFTPTIPAIFTIAVFLKQIVKKIKHEKE